MALGLFVEKAEGCTVRNSTMRGHSIACSIDIEDLADEIDGPTFL